MKLAFVFDLMDEDGDGILSKRGLWRYFRSFLCVLLTISGSSLDMTSEELLSLCDEGAVWTARRLASSFRREDGELFKGCTFENLADWYTRGGYQIATWLELLDLTKWLPLEYPKVFRSSPADANKGRSVLSGSNRHTAPAAAATRHKQDGNAYQNITEEDLNNLKRPQYVSPENPFVEDDGVEIFRADLGAENTLTLRESDSNFVLQVSQLTGFYNLTPQFLIQRLHQFARNGLLTISGYNSFVSTSVPDNLVSTQSIMVGGFLSAELRTSF
jgi:hypothetical protein